MSLESLAPDEAVALRFDTAALADELAAWCGGEVDRGDGVVDPIIWVPGRHEPHAARVGDWIVRTADCRWSAKDPVEFAAHFQPAPVG